MFICDQTAAAAASYLCQIICNRISYSHRLLCLSCRTQSAQVSLYLFTSPAGVISSWRVATVCSNFIVQQVCRVPRYCAGSVGGLTSCSQNHFMELPPSSQLLVGGWWVMFVFVLLWKRVNTFITILSRWRWTLMHEKAGRGAMEPVYFSGTATRGNIGETVRQDH